MAGPRQARPAPHDVARLGLFATARQERPGATGAPTVAETRDDTHPSGEKRCLLRNATGAFRPFGCGHSPAEGNPDTATDATRRKGA